MASDEETSQQNQTRFQKYCEQLNINPNLVMLKVTLFMMYGATASLLPFLTIHMQSIGLTVEEIAVVYLALPLTTFLSPPVTGFLVDKFGHYKSVVIFSLVLNLIFHHSLTLIPQMEIPGEMPAAYVLRHPTTGMVEVWWSPCPSRECPEEEELNMVLDDCVDHCLLQPKISPKSKFIISSFPHHQSIAVPPYRNYRVDCEKQLNEMIEAEIHRDLHFHTIHDNKKKKNGTTKTPGKKKLSFGLGNNTTSKQNVTVQPDGEEEPPAFFLLDMHPDLMEAPEHLGLEVEMDDNETVTDFRQHFSKDLLILSGVNYTALEESDLRCGGLVLATNLTMSTLQEMAADCMLQKCNFRDGGPEICPPDYKESDDRVFYIYFALRFVATIMLSASVTVMDPIALTMIQKYGGEFGRERLFSTIGMAIFSPLTGYLIDYRSKKLGYSDYTVAFYAYDALLALSAVSILMMPLSTKVPADNIMRDMLRLLKLPHVILFIFFLFVLGNCWGFIESYLFLYLKELGAPNSLLGITVSVGTLSSIPFLYGAEKLTHKIGHVNLIVIAFFSHAARLMGYSFIENAWWCFPFEAIESLSVHLMWVAAATYCAIIAPKNLLATLIGVLGMAHFSLGRGVGSFGGGLLIGTIGTRQAFRAMGLLAIVSGGLYGLIHFFWLHKYDQSYYKKKVNVKDAEKSEKEKLNVEDGLPDKDTMSHDEMLSAERLSLMIRFNHRGSLTSLDQGSRPELSRGSRRNSSYTDNKASSGSKMDLLKSTLEVNLNRNSNPHLNLTKTSLPQLNRSTTNTVKGNTETTPGTPQSNRKSQKNLVNPPSLSTVADDEFRSNSGSIVEEEEKEHHDEATKKFKQVEEYLRNCENITVNNEDDVKF
ncbi:hypothetical protein LSTR_LSTR001703 [Laodelphax striatellus]|uniref:Major facilitator superfamily associated domain-containing protein n=1 Tax=Laodelphax striatellus TaxID=195883 RepID=A0A482XCN8_LAOST|nr:hypothetical protein LSTR_LSTR001703 [Laodelphax striatellus]